jgi:hypothetical protein
MNWKEYSIIILCVSLSFILGRESTSPTERINNRMDEIELRVSDSIENHQIILNRFDRFLTDIGLAGIGIMEEETIYPPACPPEVDDCLLPTHHGWVYKFNLSKINEILKNPEKFASQSIYLTTSNKSLKGAGKTPAP